MGIYPIDLKAYLPHCIMFKQIVKGPARSKLQNLWNWHLHLDKHSK